MAITLKGVGRDILGGSFLGNLLYGGGGGMNASNAGISPAGGGQPPLGVPATKADESKGGFLAGVKDFFNSLTDRPSTNAGAAAGNAFFEKVRPFLIAGAVVGGGLLLYKVARRK